MSKIKQNITAVKNLWLAAQMAKKDQLFMKQLFGQQFRMHNPIIAFILSPSLRFTFWARLARHGGTIGRIARLFLIHHYASDVTPGRPFRHAMYVPHPVGIVIGSGACIDGDVTLYQHVTIGGDKNGRYPRLLAGSKIFPHAVVFGDITVGAGATVGAGVVANFDIAPAEIIRRMQ